ncbi:MAG TPA: histidine phosphatase family protein [Rectinemataceae bacterium]
MYSRLELEDSGSGGGGADRSSAFSEVADSSFFSEIPQKTSFLFLRHGRTEGNATFTFQGRLDYPLDELGMSQAEAAAAWIASRGADYLATSPLRRARQTAEAVAAALGSSSPEVLASLVEVDVGIFSGVEAGRAEKEHEAIFREFGYRSWDAVPNAETSAQMYARAMLSWKILRAKALAGARLLVCVTHGGTLQWLFRSTFGARTWLPLVPAGNCGVFEFVAEPSSPGRPAFVQWARVNFIPPGVEMGTKPLF